MPTLPPKLQEFLDYARKTTPHKDISVGRSNDEIYVNLGRECGDIHLLTYLHNGHFPLAHPARKFHFICPKYGCDL